MATITSLIDELKAVKAKFATEGKAAVHTALQEVFVKHPKLESFSWTQYTPYFNDGDACTFRVNAIDEFEFDGETLSEYSCSTYSDPPDWTRTVKPGFEEAFACAEDLGKLSSQLYIAEEVLEAVFGDHVQVVVTREGVSVDDCNHD